ncbi:hypothetical protein [Streptomyces sp. NBC_01618]|nr:hypothetical protein OH735_07100 [Streptomyces sp. NBC_01618]
MTAELLEHTLRVLVPADHPATLTIRHNNLVACREQATSANAHQSTEW